MLTYIFTGIIHPERVNFNLPTPISFRLDLPDFNIVGKSSISIQSSRISVQFESNIDYTKDPKCNLETLKNFIEKNIRMVVDSFCFINSYSYDVEVSTVRCEQLSINYTFGVLGEYNIAKTPEQVTDEFNKLIFIFSKPKAGFLKDVLADFRRAIKYPDMTASFCFRAVETIRTFLFEESAITDDAKRKKEGWQKLRTTFNLTEADFSQIQKFALPNRHGQYPSITGTERQGIMNFTRVIIDKSIDILLST